MDDTANSEGSQCENSSAKKNELKQKGSLDNEVLDSEGSGNTPAKRGRKRKDDWNGEKLIFSEGGNSFEIRMERNAINRYYKLDLFLNGMPIKPMTFPGTGPARSYWELLKDKMNEIENHMHEIEGGQND